MKNSVMKFPAFGQFITCCFIISCGCSSWAAQTKTQPGEIPSGKKVVASSGEIITVRAPTEAFARQGIPYFIGISQETAGAKGISMNLVVIPPGGSAKPHLHRGYETAIYLLQGSVETFYGDKLKKSVSTGQETLSSYHRTFLTNRIT
ncbi:MAG: hypothetical protein MRJ65_09045 [Candidatus Brocadiaceae bacterium]|nr:hypothetical protein [Candidatus Brocadiaceae bacterium]